jgi:nickel/cobalt transporter (NicO) family protein
MEIIFDLQRSLHSGAVDALKSLNSTGRAGLPALIGASFAFGTLHALLPGHGKSVLASYYAGEGGFRSALLSSVILIVTHVGSAVLLVLGGFIVLQRTIGGAGKAPALEHASQVFIALIGAYLLWRAMRPHTHHHGHSGPVLGFVTGLVPCPLTTFIMSYAAANGVIGAGLILAATFGAGMIVTVAAAPLLAVALRTRLLPAVSWSQQWQTRIAHGLEIASAVLVTIIGVVPLLRL